MWTDLLRVVRWRTSMRLAWAPVLVALELSGLGCADQARSRRLPASVFYAARMRVRRAPRPSRQSPSPRPAGRREGEGPALVEQALHAAGLRFGTDGTAGALWGYLRTSHQVVAP